MSESESYSEKSAADILTNAEDFNSEDDEGETANFDDSNTSNAHPIHSDKDISSDESQKDDHYEYNKNGKKSFKPKVKIKTLTIDGQLVYFCKICDKIFTRRKDKLNHELAHSGESVLTCNECGKEYLHESSLASHMRTHDGDPLYMCDLCPKMFAQSHHLKSHILSHSEPTSFVCKTCYTEFAIAADLNHHCRIQIKMEMSKYWCKMCKIYLCRGHNLTNDKRLHAFICSACNEFFYTNKKLKIHMKKFAHFSTEKAKCIEPLQEYELYPQKMTDSLRKLSAQKEIEAGKKRERSDLQNSQNIVENSEDELPAKRFKLTTRKVFLDEENSSTSMQDSLSEIKVEQDLKSPNKHRKGKPYCKKCNRSFKDNFELDRHKSQVHNEENSCHPSSLLCNADEVARNKHVIHSIKHGGHSVNCPVCGESFTCSMKLTSHLKSHSEELAHKCSHCGKGFKHKIQLLEHIRLHLSPDKNMNEMKLTTKIEPTGTATQLTQEEGIFKCHLCFKIFHFRYKLLNHMRLHTNVKCFQCYICHKAFATKHYLQKHLQVHLKQGMDVDLSNIIVDEDHKVGISDARNNGLVDLASQVFENRLTNSKGLHEAKRRFKKGSTSDCFLQSRSFISVNGKDIKIEPLHESDSESENSGCSCMTRDSEKSDPFRFSSDESNSFKTTMAKERRRLKRKWLQLARKTLPLKRLKEEDGKCLIDSVIGNDDDDDDDDVTDMMVELNGVQSETDNVMTIYVDLSHMRKLVKKIEQILPIMHLDSNANLPNKEDLHSQDIIKNEAQDEDRPLKVDISEKAGLNDNLSDSVKYQKQNSISQEQLIPHKNIKVPENKVSPKLCTIDPNTHCSSNAKGDSSNLEKLKVAFEVSSKYLPSPSSPTSISKVSSSICPEPLTPESNRKNANSSVENDASCLNDYNIEVEVPLVIDIPPELTSPKIKVSHQSLIGSCKVSISTPSSITSEPRCSTANSNKLAQLHSSYSLPKTGSASHCNLPSSGPDVNDSMPHVLLMNSLDMYRNTVVSSSFDICQNKHSAETVSSLPTYVSQSEKPVGSVSFSQKTGPLVPNVSQSEKPVSSVSFSQKTGPLVPNVSQSEKPVGSVRFSQSQNTGPLPTYVSQSEKPISSVAFSQRPKTGPLVPYVSQPQKPVTSVAFSQSHYTGPLPTYVSQSQKPISSVAFCPKPKTSPLVPNVSQSEKPVSNVNFSQSQNTGPLITYVSQSQKPVGSVSFSQSQNTGPLPTFVSQSEKPISSVAFSQRPKTGPLVPYVSQPQKPVTSVAFSQSHYTGPLPTYVSQSQKPISSVAFCPKPKTSPLVPNVSQSEKPVSNVNFSQSQNTGPLITYVSQSQKPVGSVSFSQSQNTGSLVTYVSQSQKPIRSVSFSQRPKASPLVTYVSQSQKPVGSAIFSQSQNNSRHPTYVSQSQKLLGSVAFSQSQNTGQLTTNVSQSEKPVSSVRFSQSQNTGPLPKYVSQSEKQIGSVTFPQTQNIAATSNALPSNQSQGTFSLNVSSIFDASNPVLRDMNMLDLVSPSPNVSSFSGNPSNLPGSAFSVLQPSPIRPVDSQNMSSYSVQSSNPCQVASLNPVANPRLYGHHQNAGVSNMSTSGVQLNNLISSGGLSVHLGQLQSSLPRDSLLENNAGMFPSLPGHMNGPLSVTPAPHFSYGLPQLPGVASLGPNVLDSSRIINLSGQVQTVLGGLPVNVLSNPMFVNSCNSSSSLLGMQDQMVNTNTPLGVCLLNQSVGVNGFLPGASYPMLNNFNPGYYTQFP